MSRAAAIDAGHDGLEPEAAVGVRELVAAQPEAPVVVLTLVVGMPEVEQRAADRVAAAREHPALEHDAVAREPGLEQRGAARRAWLEERTLGLGRRGLVVVTAAGRGLERPGTPGGGIHEQRLARGGLARPTGLEPGREHERRGEQDAQEPAAIGAGILGDHAGMLERVPRAGNAAPGPGARSRKRPPRDPLRLRHPASASLLETRSAILAPARLSSLAGDASGPWPLC